MKTINFETLKVGDTVECLLNGKGVVIRVRNNFNYPITVDFNHTEYNYTKYGKILDEHLIPSLYLEAPKFSEYPKEMVVDDGSVRTIIGYYNWFYHDAFGMRYSHAKDITPKRQLTKEQFKDEFGVEFDNIEIL